MDITTVAFAGYRWKTGKEIINVELTLGSADKASSCYITLSDPRHIIAEACINHSLKEGGIFQLPDKSSTTVPIDFSKLGKTGTTVGTARPSKNFSAQWNAFADTVAWKETQAAKDDDKALSYRARNGGGYFDARYLLPGAGFPPPQPGGGNIGRYQFNKGDWQDAVKAGYAKDFTPEDQDGIFRYKLERLGRGGKQLNVGDIRSALGAANGEWKSVPGRDMSQVQAGSTTETYIAYYQSRLQLYTAGKPVANRIPVSSLPTPPSKTDTTSPVIKGSIITVTIDGYSFQFYHQSTDMSQAGITILSGHGIRWLMSRRTRSRTVKDISLKMLAEQLTETYNFKLDYQTKLNPTFDHLDQSGISDYSLLLREANEVGLMVTEDMNKQTFIIKGRENLKDNAFILSRGDNLISYSISDKALSGNEPTLALSTANDSKVFLDPISGKMTTTKLDKDRQNSSYTTTGKTKGSVSGTMKTGDKTIAVKNSEKTRRIGGLPSTFVLPLSYQTMILTASSAIKTKGFPGCLDRIWVIKTVTHNIAENTTTLALNSPVDIKTPAIDFSKLNTAPSNIVVKGSINERIFQAATQLRGYDTTKSTVGGRVACAWVVNRVVLKAAGVPIIGQYPDNVDSVRSALAGGRGTAITASAALPGDILVMGSGARAHIGIYMGDGRILSNSSSKGSFTWFAPQSDYEPYYPGGFQYYRVTR